MLVIYKWQLTVSRHQEVVMQRGARILTVQNQGGMLCLWAIVNPEAPTESRYFSVFGTGHPHESFPQNYIGTCQQGQYVWHVFED